MGVAIHLGKVFTEVSLAGIESGLTSALSKRLFKNHPLSDERQILTLFSGFLAPSWTLKPIKDLAKIRNHSVYDWEGAHRNAFLKPNVNYGPVTNSLEASAEHVVNVSERHGGTKLTLGGHSLGGAYGLAVTAYLKEQGYDIVGRVITMGSPLTTRVLDLDHMQVHEGVKALFNKLNPPDHPNMKEFIKYAQMAEDGALEGTPVVHFYSQNDFIVDKAISSSMAQGRENIEVRAPHLAFAQDLAVQYTLMDRLERSYDDFTPFDITDEEHPKWITYKMPEEQWHTDNHPENTLNEERHAPMAAAA